MTADRPTRKEERAVLTFRDHNDALRAHSDWRRYLAAHHESVMYGWVSDRFRAYGRRAAAPSIVAFEHMISDTNYAETGWVTEEMMDLCQHAMETFDMSEPFAMEDAFIPNGFMVLPHPWRTLDVNEHIIGHRV